MVSAVFHSPRSTDSNNNAIKIDTLYPINTTARGQKGLKLLPAAFRGRRKLNTAVGVQRVPQDYMSVVRVLNL